MQRRNGIRQRDLTGARTLRCRRRRPVASGSVRPPLRRAFAKETALASHDRAPAEIRWLIVPLHLPRALRHCAGCGDIRPFASSGRFRVNAQKRRLDVWLIYRCDACDRTWNLEVLSRVRPEQIDPALLSAFLRNDADTAEREACDAARILRTGVRLEPAAAVRIERPDGEWPGLQRGGPALRIRVAAPCALRLDRLLAAELRWSRATLARTLAEGSLRIEPGGIDALRRPVRDGTLLRG